ncbi:hypothetical protein [Salinibacterium sp. PAMC 21357]|uniref:hypothetical protein n=1 Tax=Salinibacterium sp. PAMC 21357 TaxID=1112215 RepID=UPI0002893A45|nr:hypothetical protein [Salinibacterium sp. PAMC 21357]
MTKSQAASSSRLIWALAAIYSVAVLAVGLWASFATGEWIALLAASGLVIVPVVTLGFRRRQPH